MDKKLDERFNNLMKEIEVKGKSKYYVQPRKKRIVVNKPVVEENNDEEFKENDNSIFWRRHIIMISKIYGYNDAQIKMLKDLYNATTISKSGMTNSVYMDVQYIKEVAERYNKSFDDIVGDIYGMNMYDGAMWSITVCDDECKGGNDDIIYAIRFNPDLIANDEGLNMLHVNIGIKAYHNQNHVFINSVNFKYRVIGSGKFGKITKYNGKYATEDNDAYKEYKLHPRDIKAIKDFILATHGIDKNNDNNN